MKYDLYGSHAWYVPGIKGMFALWGLFLAGSLLGSVALVLLDHFTPQYVQAYEILLVEPLNLLPAFIYVYRKSCRNKATEVGYKLDSSHFGQFSGWQIALVTVVLSLAYLLAVEPITDWFFNLTMLVPGMKPLFDFIEEIFEKMTIGPFWVTFISVAVYAAVFEEWLCRGVLLRGLLVRMKPVWAIVVSALFFSVIHMNPWQGLNAFLLGLLLGYIYYKTGSLWLTMLLHFVNNGTAIALSQIPSLQEAESFRDIMPPTAYAVAVCAALVILLVCLCAFHSIPLEQKRGNIDRA